MSDRQAPADAKRERIQKLLAIMQKLSEGQLFWLEKVINIFDVPGQYEVAPVATRELIMQEVPGGYPARRSELITEEILHDFGDALKIHHAFSVEPFTKDKFEYVLEQILRSRGVNAKLAPKTNRGHDIEICGQKFSLKTQADKGIRIDEIWISKFMELGGGKWGDDPKDLEGLRDQFLGHLRNYDRILTLRTLSKAPDWKYELVEIPKALFLRAYTGQLKMMTTSKQHPKPGYCYVSSESRTPLYELYFDGGGERKLQVKKLRKSACVVHATWGGSIPQI